MTEVSENRPGGDLDSVLLQAVDELGEGFVVTEAGRCIYANDAYCQMTGYSRAEIMSFPTLIELAPVEERELLVARLRERLAGGQVTDHYEAGLIRKDGERRDVEVAVKLIASDSGTRLISIVRDVTERKRLQSFKDSFIATATHELRNPLSVISGTAQVLNARLDELSHEDLRSLISALERQTARVQRLVHRLLDLARFEQGRLELEPERVRVRDAVRSSVELIELPPGKSIDVDVDAEMLVKVDPVRLEQMLSNLLVNAVRYGGDHIRVTALLEDGEIDVVVTDDGPGIPEELSGRMFEPFSRGHHTRAIEGAGLGLSIVRAVAEASGGSVRYEPVATGGSRFIVTLPAG